MSEEKLVEEKFEGQVEDQSKVTIGLHPLGGLGINVRGIDGSVAEARLGIEEAWVVSGHINALLAMIVQQMYTRAIVEQQEAERQASKIFVPNR